MSMTRSMVLSFAFIVAAAAVSDDVNSAIFGENVAATQAPGGTWSKVKSQTWCKNRIVIGSGSWEDCQKTVLADTSCAYPRVTYSNSANDKCFCVPAGEKCDEASAKVTDLYTFTETYQDNYKAQAVQGTWKKTKVGTWCKNRIIIGTGWFEDCLEQVLNEDTRCSKVTYSNPKNDKCFCVPRGEDCQEASAGFTDVYSFTAAPSIATKGSALAAQEDASDWDGACKEQERFDVMMCESFMCTQCALDFCMTSCQEVQLDFPTCRCKNWPAARKSYSGGDFASKGKFGDVGDYAAAAAAFLSTEITSEE